MKIRFRVWNKERREMRGGGNFMIDTTGILYWQFGYEEACPQSEDDFETMQFTGLFDRDGREICEGDVIQWKGHEVSNGKQVRPIRRRCVGATKDPFRISFIDDCFHIQNMCERKTDIEVIGNIYENPELVDESGIPDPPVTAPQTLDDFIIQEAQDLEA